MLESARLVFGSVGLFLLSLLLVACAETTAARDDPGPINRTGAPSQIPTETTGMHSTSTPTPPPQPTADIPDLGPAPEITNEVWINTPAPLTLQGLRGKVVLVEFWTYG